MAETLKDALKGDIVVYSKDGCPFCDKAKGLLTKEGVPFTVITVNDMGERQRLYDVWGLVGTKRTMPQIFEDVHPGELKREPNRIGGYLELVQRKRVAEGRA